MVGSFLTNIIIGVFMKDLMKKLMESKESDSSDVDMKKKAKLNVLHELKKMASDMMGDDVKGGMMKKVTVAAPSEKGLEKGLDKAKELVADMPEPEEMDYDEESSDEEDMEECSPEEIDAKIAKLQAMKSKMSK